MPKFSLEPETRHLPGAEDAWLFDSETAVEVVRKKLSNEMNGLAESLSDLREALALIHGETPFPVEATTLAPCAVLHHDDMLFDGEADAPYLPAQEEISGGEGVFLTIKAPGRTDKAQIVHTGDFHYRTLGRQITTQADNPAGNRNRR